MRRPWSERLQPLSRVPAGAVGGAVPGRGRRPTLLIVVYGVCLVLVGITASAQAGVISANYQTSALRAVVSDDAALIRAVVNSTVTAADLSPRGPTADRREALGGNLRQLVFRAGIVRVELRGTDGSLIASDVDLPPDSAASPSESLRSALAGQPSAMLVTPDTAGQAGARLESPTLIREDLPLVDRDGTVRAVMTVWRDGQPIVEQMEHSSREVVLLTLTAAAILAIVLFFVFKTAQERITRQTEALVEATRRDVVTGLLNHGAIVDELARALERTQANGSTITVALVDIDNFRLANDTHGHAFGDEVLRAVATTISAAMPSGAHLGRYGPDEILAFAPGSAARFLPYLQSVRSALAGTSLRIDQGEQLPITISAGLAEAPTDAEGVTALLALAAGTLGAAKASGGDSLRTTRREADAAETRGFDVLAGLVIAIDTKDRYTKRHSEDVARYGLFIADRLGLDVEMRRTIRLAGLLHDVGKIGIPDQVLRKPGPLTDAEYGIVKQHVALGDMIVRDLPDIDAVRAGIRHHHERWDGKGYLHGLAGTNIPLVARILAVGDAFSAMTTSRPYRRALSVREAIIRLLDAAGTQLDEEIVDLFVAGLESAPDAPLPGAPVVALWVPDSLAPEAAA